MKAMTIRSFGATDVFEASEVDKPKAQEGHVVVKVAATSVNTVDTMIRQMGEALPFSPKLPAILGMDFAGTVDEVGSGVTKFSVGDEVYGCAGGLADLQGTLAEFMVADQDLVSLKPKSLSMKEAAALPLVGITAYEGLVRAGVGSGQSVLVHGGAGGVGHVAVQIAKALGADVWATGSSQDQMDAISGFGATPINYKNEAVSDYVQKHTSGDGFDVVYDSVGGANIANSFEAATLNGQVATTVSLLEMDLSVAHMKGLSLHVVFMLIPMIHGKQRSVHGDVLATLAKLVDDGKLTPLVDPENFELQDVGKAHAHLASGNAHGKIVISV